MGDATRATPGGNGAYTGAGSLAMTTRMQRSQDTLWSLSADTGGKALLDVNDLGLGIVNAQKAITSYYVLGFYTSNALLDCKQRKIKVQASIQGDSVRVSGKSKDELQTAMNVMRGLEIDVPLTFTNYR